jgi:hypothetical protein
MIVHGILLTLFFPKFGSERLTRHHIMQKAVAAGAMFAGVVITFAG